MVAEPKFPPVMVGCTTGAVVPEATKTDDGEMATFEESLLENETVTPPTGAAELSVTGKGRDWLGLVALGPLRVIVPEDVCWFVNVNTAGVAAPAALAVTW